MAYDKALAEKVFKKWKNECACRYVASITDCPGFPSKWEIDEVREALDAGTVDQVDIDPFDRPDDWEGWLEL